MQCVPVFWVFVKVTELPDDGVCVLLVLQGAHCQIVVVVQLVTVCLPIEPAYVICRINF